MYFRLNKGTLNLDVLVGVMETYSPNDDAIDVLNKVEELKKKTSKFIEDTFKTNDQNEIIKMIKENKELENLWKVYLSEVYNKDVLVIEERVNTLNKQFGNGVE